MTWLYRDAPPTFRTTTTTTSGATVVVAQGRVAFPHVSALGEELETHIRNGATRIAVDLSRVDNLDSSGVGAMIGALKTVRAAGGDLRLVRPSMPVSSVIGLMKLDGVLTSHDSAEEAFPPQASPADTP